MARSKQPKPGISDALRLVWCAVWHGLVSQNGGLRCLKCKPVAHRKQVGPQPLVVSDEPRPLFVEGVREGDVQYTPAEEAKIGKALGWTDNEPGAVL